PARDSAKALRSWLDHFDKRFIGLTGTEAAIEDAQLAAGLPPARKSALANGDYGLSHSSFVLVYTKDNLAHLIYPGGMSQQDWALDLPLLVQEGAWSRRCGPNALPAARFLAGSRTAEGDHFGNSLQASVSEPQNSTH